jgi:hypothetical protein
MNVLRFWVAMSLLVCSTAFAEDAKLVENPDFAAWAKVPKGTQLKISVQKVNIMQPARVQTLTLEKVSADEVFIASSTDGDRKITAKIPAAKLPKDQRGEKAERKLTDGSIVACTQVTRKVEGEPDMKLWLCDAVPGGVVEREWEEGKHGTIVEKVLAFKAPDGKWKEFEQAKPDPNSAHPIDTPPPEVQQTK